MDDFFGWLGYVSATFVGTGSALVTLRFLSDTILGHWLAKGLVKFTAQIETSEVRKRIATERRDNDRNQAITQIMAAVADHAILFAYAPQLDTKDGPENAYMQRYRELCQASQAVTTCALKMAHLFDVEEKLIQLCLEWSSEAQVNANRYFDVLSGVVDEEHWSLPMQERVLRLAGAHGALTSSPHPANEKLVKLCRQMAAVGQ